MAFTDRYTGENLKIRMTPTGGSEYVITGDYTAFSHGFTQDNVDVTAGNAQAKAKLQTKNDLSWSIDVFDGDIATWNSIVGLSVATGVINVRPHGDGTGLEEFTFSYIIEKGDRATGTDKAATLTMSGSRSGAMTLPFGSVQGAIRHLVFTTQPTNTVSTNKIASVIVSVEDPSNAVVTTENSDVITITKTGASVASGVLIVRVINGVASFPGIVMTGVATGETLTATSSAGYTLATSSTFNVT